MRGANAKAAVRNLRICKTSFASGSARGAPSKPRLKRDGPPIALHSGRGEKMPLLNIVVMLIIAGVALYLINRYIPMASSIKSILNIVVVVAVCVWVLQVTGLWGTVSTFRLSR
jgi:hypothetical protein